MKVVLLGGPGSGKGTQAKLISENFNIPHISIGDIVRLNIREKTKLGAQMEEFVEKGQLVPDNITISMIEDRLNEEDCRNGFVIDGFPGNRSQAESLDEILGKKGQRIDRALFFNVPEYVILERVKDGQVCECCGAIFHSKFNPNKVEKKCDICRGTLIQKQGDNLEIIKNRIETYENSIYPILDYYGDGGPLLVINGHGEIKDICRTVNKALKAI